MAEDDKYLLLPPLKREKIKKALHQQKKVEMRQALPVLNFYEIRRHRLPYYQALLADLKDFNYPNSEKFLRHLIENQQALMEKYGEMHEKLQLTSSRKILDHLYESLRKSEEAARQGEHLNEFNQLVNLGLHYSFSIKPWWWIGENILLKALELTSFDENEAKVRFILGKFYLKQMKDYYEAKTHLEIAVNLATGQEWQLPLNLRQENDDTIYSQSCYLMWKIFMMEARLENDPKTSIEFCKMAKQMAANACFKLGEIESLMLSGQRELDLEMTIEAIVTFGKVLRMATQEVHLVAVCEAKLKLALALLLHGYWKQALDELRVLRKFADDHELSYYSAQALGYLGEFFLKQNKPGQATPFLLVALKSFSERLQDTKRQEEIREMAAISCADELMDEYKELVMNFDSDPECMNKLINWNHSREIFWEGTRGFNLTDEDAIKMIEEEEEQEIQNLMYD